MKHILFITSTNLASNPRCRKEVELALMEGYRVSVIAFKLPNWTWDKEKTIQRELKDVNYHYLPADRSSTSKWLRSVIYEKAGRMLFKIGMKSLKTLGVGVNRRAILIKRLMYAEGIKPDVIVAHNPGAFWPAIKALENGCKVGIDVEDFHPGEGTDPVLNSMQAELLRKVLPRATYVSYASEPIMAEVKTILNGVAGKQHFCVRNMFPRRDFPQPGDVPDRLLLQLVWFSQNIDAGRGLEQLLPVLDKFRGRLQLTLIGNADTEFCRQFVKPRDYIIIRESMAQPELHQQIGAYDIGLAIEPGKDLNNLLALSNKICTYFQAGLYMIATATTAQELFMKSFPDHGKLIDLKMEELQSCLENILASIGRIRGQKRERWVVAQEHSWENENEKLRLLWANMNS